MRLTANERATILRVADRLTEGRGRVWFFGSRTDDSARGGDLDLMVESPVPVHREAKATGTLLS